MADNATTVVTDDKAKAELVKAPKVLEREERDRVKDTRPDGRVFISPTQPDSRFLVRRGILPPGVTNELSREDIFVEFSAGICYTRNAEQIAWLEAHDAFAAPGEHQDYHLRLAEKTGSISQYDRSSECPNRAICSDASRREVAAWSDVEQRKLALGSRDRQLPAGYDTMALLQGNNPDPSGAIDLINRAHSAMGINTNNPERFWPKKDEE